MWYSRKIESSGEKFSTKYIKFSFQNSGNVREDKNLRRWTTFGFNNKNKSFFRTGAVTFQVCGKLKQVWNLPH